MRAADFDFQLPTQLVAQRPCHERDQSRLLVLRRGSGALSHHSFAEFPGFLRAGDLLVLNDSKVIPARLRGTNHRTGGAFEILLLEENSRNDWWAMLRPGKRAPIGTRIDLAERRAPARRDSKTFAPIPAPHAERELGAPRPHAIVTATNDEGHRRLQFSGCENILDALDALGEVPLPPYIKRNSPHDPAEDIERYQTIYAHAPGSVAAPTAGLHFTPAVMGALRRAGVQMCHVTLHVGPGTFAPVKTDDLAQHLMHEERFVISDAAAERITAAKAEGRRVIAVGTTSVRVLESAVVGRGSRRAETFSSITARQEPRPTETEDPHIPSGSGRTRIFIHPPHRFRVVDALLTNFHLPRSTLLMLVSAFAAPGDTRGRDLILTAYHEAIAKQYRFFSYGDAMFIE